MRTRIGRPLGVAPVGFETTARRLPYSRSRVLAGFVVRSIEALAGARSSGQPVRRAGRVE